MMRSTCQPVVSSVAAYLVTDILSSETVNPQNPYLGRMHIESNGQRHAVVLKTGTSDGARDMWAAGYLPPPLQDGYAMASVVWLGNYDGSPTGGTTALHAAAPIWHAFLRAVAKRTRVGNFVRPRGLMRATIDAHSGFCPGPWTQALRQEWFLPSTLPGKDPTKQWIPPSETADGCIIGGWLWDWERVEAGYPQWQAANQAWAAHAARGTGIASSDGLVITYFFDERYAPYGVSWSAGVSLADCSSNP